MVKPGFSTSDCKAISKKAEQEIERVLREQPTLLVIDNMESILLPPFMEEETPEALSEEAREELKAILALCERLLKVGDTRLVFTSREALPAPFDAERHRRELHQLDREDAVKLVERVLNAAGGDAGASSDAAREEIEQLVDAVHCHARTLALLAPALRSRGVEATRESLVELMAEMEKKFPGSREKSVFASVELSLRRMSEANRDRARVLGVFHGGVDLDVLRMMMEWEEADVASLAGELIETGLATPNRYNHLTLNPALCPYLRGRMDAAEREALTARWVEAMRAYAEFLVQQQSQNAEVAATLTVLELPNLFALLDLVQRAGDAEATIDLATSLYSLLRSARQAAAAGARGAGARRRGGGAGRRLESRAVRGGADPHRAAACRRALARGVRRRAAVAPARPGGGRAGVSRRRLRSGDGLLPPGPRVADGRRIGTGLAAVGRGPPTLRGRREGAPGKAAERMASVCFAEQGDCLLDLGRLDEAAAAYEESIRRAEQLGDDRSVAVGKGQLGTVRMHQRRYPEALAAYDEARERFTQLDEPGSVAVIWHQTGMVYQEAGQPEAAEDAYRKSLAIEVRLGNVAGQASTLGQLGILYDDVLGPTGGSRGLSTGKRRTSMSRSVMWRTKGGRGAISPSRCASSVASTKRGRKSVGRSNATRSSATRLSRGRLGTSSPTSRRTPATPPPPRRRSARPSPATSPTAATAARTTIADGRISLAVTQSLLAGDPATAASLLQQLAADPEVARVAPPLHPRPPSHRRRQPRPHPRRRPGFGLLDGRRNPLPDRELEKAGK